MGEGGGGGSKACLPLSLQHTLPWLSCQHCRIEYGPCTKCLSKRTPTHNDGRDGRFVFLPPTPLYCPFLLSVCLPAAMVNGRMPGSDCWTCDQLMHSLQR